LFALKANVPGEHSPQSRPYVFSLQTHCPDVVLHTLAVPTLPALPAAEQLHGAHVVTIGGVDVMKEPSAHVSHSRPAVPAVQLHTSPPPLYLKAGAGSLAASYEQLEPRP